MTFQSGFYRLFTPTPFQTIKSQQSPYPAMGERLNKLFYICTTEQAGDNLGWVGVASAFVPPAQGWANSGYSRTLSSIEISLVTCFLK